MSIAVKTGLCDNCRELKPVAWTDSIGREYCAMCLPQLPVPTAWRIVEHLVRTIPFQVGDRVQCRTAGVLYNGIGTIDEVSMDPQKFGTPVFPSFHVVLEEKAYPTAPQSCWYTEVCLKKVTDDE